MLTMADNGGMGGKANADNDWQRGEGGKANADIGRQRGAGVLATNDISDKKTKKYHTYWFFLNSSLQFNNFG